MPPILSVQKRRSDQLLFARAFMRSIFVTTVFLFMILNAATRSAEAQTLEVLGQAGVLGEWELTANMIAAATGVRNQFSGPLIMKHVGICTVDGPEEKIGEIQLQLFGSSLVKATLVVAGVTCTYAGRKSDSFSGMMRCPGQRDVPLRMWLK
jgi:hypothetical protein